MGKLLTKKNGYRKTSYTFLNEYTGNRRIYYKDEKFYIEVNGKITDVTDEKYRYYFWNDKLNKLGY